MFFNEKAKIVRLSNRPDYVIFTPPLTYSERLPASQPNSRLIARWSVALPLILTTHGILPNVRFLPKKRRRFAGDPLEWTVELWQRFKPNCKRNFTDALVRIGQQIFCLLNTKPGQIIDKSHPTGFFEYFAKMTNTHIGHLSGLPQGKRILRMVGNINFDALDGIRFE